MLSMVMDCKGTCVQLFMATTYITDMTSCPWLWPVGVHLSRLGTVAGSDGTMPVTQTVAGLILMSGNILSWRLVMKYFLRPFDSSRAVVNYWWKDVHLVQVNRSGLSLPRKSVVRLTGRLNMTIVDWDVKPQISQPTFIQLSMVLTCKCTCVFSHLWSSPVTVETELVVTECALDVHMKCRPFIKN